MKLKRPDGSLSEIIEENTEIMKQYLYNFFSKDGTHDNKAINLVQQRKTRHWMYRPPSEEEVLSAVSKMNK